MPDYAKTLIYKLINYDYPDLVYVGSTTNFTKRKQHHKERCLNPNDKIITSKCMYLFVKMVDGMLGI